MFLMRTRLPAVGSVVLAAGCLTSIARAQTSWWRTFGGTNYDVGNIVQQTVDGGYIIVGGTTSFGAGNSDVYLIRTDTSGDTLWTRTYGGRDTDWGYWVQQTADSGYIVAGGTCSFGAGSADVYLIKSNASGDTLWTRTYGGANGDGGYSVQQTADGGYIITGWTECFGAGAYDVYLIKTDASGDTLWARTYGGTSEDVGYSVQQTTDSGYIITGHTLSFGAGRLTNVYLIKTNASGDTLWTRAYGGTGVEWGYDVQQTMDGGYIIVGCTQSFGAGIDDVYFIKTDASGDTLWTKTYGGTDDDVGKSVRQASDGGYVIAGYTGPFGPGNQDVRLIRTNASGDTLWTKTYGGPDSDEGYSVRQTPDGGHVVAGYAKSFGAGNADVYLIKTDSLGNATAVAEHGPMPQAIGHKLAATVIRNLPENTTAFDAMGRRVLHQKPGIYFLRTASTAAPRKVLLVE